MEILDDIEGKKVGLKISVIIPTYNGAQKIPKIIDALDNQSYKNFEIVIAIDGSKDNTLQIARALATQNPNIKVYYQENNGRAAIRNYGAKMASGQLLIFYDDDMVPAKDSVQKHVSFHTRIRNSICGGNQLEDIAKSKTDIQKYKAWLSRKWTAKYQSGLNKLTSLNMFLTAANFSLSKTVFESLNGFDERLSDAEDLDFALRAYRSDFSLYFDKSNVAWHNDFITCKSYVQRKRDYFYAHTELKELYPELDHPLLANKSHQTTIMKKCIYSFFSFWIWVKMIDLGLFARLPKKLKYTIYDLVIMALSTHFNRREID
jgi:glycosyltransferase involved in cell wall biosynthesis